LFEQLQTALKGEGQELVQRTKASCSVLDEPPGLPASAFMASGGLKPPVRCTLHQRCATSTNSSNSSGSSLLRKLPATHQ
jgi:hypothetical protein